MTHLREQVAAGLRLYVTTVEPLADAVLISQTVELIQTELANQA